MKNKKGKTRGRFITICPNHFDLLNTLIWVLYVLLSLSKDKNSNKTQDYMAPEPTRLRLHVLQIDVKNTYCAKESTAGAKG